MEIKDLFHSHSLSKPGPQPELQHIARISDLQSKIPRQLTVQIASSQILSDLRLNDADARNPMFTQQDIWNFNVLLHRYQLGTLFTIQALVQKLNRGDLVYKL